MNHNSRKFELPDVHMESDDEIMQRTESEFSNSRITDQELQTLTKHSSASEKQKGFMPCKSDTIDFPTLYLLPLPKTTTNFKEQLCQLQSISDKMFKCLLEIKKQNKISKKLSYKNKTTTEKNTEAGDGDKDEDDQNSAETFDCSDCSINLTNDDSDLEPDIITCQFIKIKNKPEKWRKKCKTELTKLSGKYYGVDDLQGLISWS